VAVRGVQRVSKGNDVADRGGERFVSVHSLHPTQHADEAVAAEYEVSSD
jgi:hypothetical protein